ncbi:MFS transporter [Roseibium denhamense]|uniref:MFS transporter, BCD family, chlorophyll transporter n=1 Tax=Roseibium denhamense TaxID=76305 RepID=A0ABY1PLU2_9HYPH|nr:BCD family MFS transporter [Roseibium denhamense]MTI03995.1 MFS transporter [Roseibium denhamense]SMP36174.1 MFS transporter, BCD family, chlorophyll transporter [Roseibium denhamense]
MSALNSLLKRSPEARSRRKGLSWLAIIRLGLVQASLGSVVVLTNSTLNRVFIVELGLIAMLPGILVGIHYAVQLARPVWGHKSDIGSSRTLWILSGLALLAASGTGASATTLLFEWGFAAGLAAAILAYILIGFGVGACGTSLLALMAAKTAPERRAPAATITWLMMIAGIAITSIVTGLALEPYSHARLIAVTAVTGIAVFVISVIAISGIEQQPSPDQPHAKDKAGNFRESLMEVWHDPEARMLTLFIFMSMLAYSTQDLILEPYAGLLFGMTPGESTQLSGVQHGGVFAGMAAVGLLGGLFSKRKPGLMKIFIVTGCFGSGLALALLALSASFAPAWPLAFNIFVLGVMNGAFAVAAIGTMMVLAGRGKTSNEGMRMGVWGAAQAISFGLGGVAGTVALTLGRWATQSDSIAFAMVFSLEAGLFFLSALIALRIGMRPAEKRGEMRSSPSLTPVPAE